MIDDPLSFVTCAIWLMAASMYPLGFLFGACSPCCQGDDDDDGCQWTINLNRCMRVGIVGSNPPAGGHCAISTWTQSVSPVSGYRTNGGIAPAILTVHDTAESLLFSLQLSFPGSTPVGASRSATYRFTRPNPPDPTLFDEIGPTWHLEFELNVTGVALDSDAGIVSQATTQDSEGQVKLILNINHGPVSRIFTADPIAITPVGLQKVPGYRFTETIGTFALTQRVSGFLFIGLGPTGTFTRTQSTYVVQFGDSVCPLVSSVGANLPTQLKRTWITRDVEEFLNGESTVTVSAQGGFPLQFQDYAITLLPQSALCDFAPSMIGTGVTLGIYPPIVYGDVPASITSNPDFCEEEATIEFEADSQIDTTPSVGIGISPLNPCVSAWFRKGYERNAYTLSAGRSAIDVYKFYDGQSLLWNAENGPSRLEFQENGWTYRVGGQNQNPVGAFYTTPHYFPPSGYPCRGDLVTGPLQGQPGARGNVCYPPAVNVQVAAYDLVVPGLILQESGDSVSVSGGGYEAAAGWFRALNTGSDLEYYYSRGPQSSAVYRWNNEWNLEVFWTEAIAVVGAMGDICTLPKVVNTSIHYSFVRVSAAGVRTVPFPTTAGPSTTITDVNVSSTSSAVTIRPRTRLNCDQWAPDPVGAQGGTLSRQCAIVDEPSLGDVIGYVSQTLQIPQSRNLVARVIGDETTQEASCRLLSMRNIRSAFGDGLTHSLFLTTEFPCAYLMPMFGATAGVNCASATSTLVSAPCPEGCELIVEVIENAEEIEASYITSGPRAGLVRISTVNPTGAWNGLARMSVTCGPTTIIVTLVS